jgi:hypothetical protein
MVSALLLLLQPLSGWFSPSPLCYAPKPLFWKSNAVVVLLGPLMGCRQYDDAPPRFAVRYGRKLFSVRMFALALRTRQSLISQTVKCKAAGTAASPLDSCIFVPT